MTCTPKHEFAERLRNCRENAGFKTQQDFATAIDANRSTVSRAENKDHMGVPPPDTFSRMEEELRRGDPEGRPCTKEELRHLEAAWQRARQESDDRRHTIDDPTLQVLASALDAWPGSSAEHMALIDELRLVAENWQSYRQAMNDLRKGGMYPYARDVFEALRPKVDGQPRLKMRVLVGLARTRRYFGETKAAIDEELTEALKIAEELDPLELEEHASILILTGDFHRRFGGLEDALTYYEQSASVSKRILEERVSRRGIARIERKIASVWLFRGDATKAEEHCRRSIRLCKELGDPDGLRKAEQHLAWALALLGNYTQALDLHQGVLALIGGAESILLFEVAKAKRYFADVLRMCGRCEEALDMYTEAGDDLRRYRQHAEASLTEEETLVRGPILVGLGQTYRKMGRLNEASAALADSERANANDPFFFALTQSELGRLAVEQGKYDEAVRRFERAYAQFEKSPNVYYIAATQINRAELEHRRGNIAGVRLWAQKVTQRVTDDNIRVHRARGHTWLAIADMNEWIGESPAAEFFVALRMAIEELDNPYLCREVLERFKGQLIDLKERQESSKLRRLYEDITGWRARLRSHNRTMQTMLSEWHKEVETLCANTN